MQMKFRATSDVKIVRRSLKTVKYEQQIGARENIYWNNASLLIPAYLNVPSTHRPCIITVSYFLLLSLRAAAITRTFTLAIPIKIGKIPLRLNSNGLEFDRGYSVLPPTYEKCIEEDNKTKGEEHATTAKDTDAVPGTSAASLDASRINVRPTTARPPSYRLFVRPTPSYNQRMNDQT